MSDRRLLRFCHSSRTGITKPFLVEWEGREWACATNGYSMLLLSGVSAPLVPNAPMNVNEVLAKCAFDERGVEVDLARLVEFVGVVDVERVHDFSCPKCKGTGRVDCVECKGNGFVTCTCEHCDDEHEVECNECDDDCTQECPLIDGDDGAEIRRVQIGRSEFNAEMVAHALANAERTAGVATWYEAAMPRPTAVRGDGWVLLLMPLRLEDLSTNIPHFDVSPKVAA